MARRKLSDAQRRLLETLARWGPRPTAACARADGAWDVSAVCAAALERAGLVEGHYTGTPSVWKVEITEAGRRALTEAATS